MQDIYKILGFPEEMWKKLDEDYAEIVKFNMAADVAEVLTEGERVILEKALEGKSDLVEAMKQWSSENHEASLRIAEKSEKSWLDSSAKFLEVLMKNVTAEKRQEVVTFLQRSQNG